MQNMQGAEKCGQHYGEHMKYKIERTGKRHVKYTDLKPGDLIELDNKIFIAQYKLGRECDECAFADKTGYCLVNIHGGYGDKLCQTDNYRLLFKNIDDIMENL